jgi:hypothetical protein
MLMRSLVVIVVATSVTSAVASAQTQGDDRFTVGAPLREVLAAWGEPDERVVREVKHELVWNYKGGARVVFKEGKVLSYRTAESTQQQQAKKAAAAEAAKKTKTVSTESQDMLRDIVREIPSGADGPVPPDAPQSNDPNLQGLIPNAVPGRNGQPAIAPGVVVPSLEDDQ